MSDSYYHSENAASTANPRGLQMVMNKILIALWLLSLVAAVAVFFWYHPPRGHGPDMLGQKLVAILVPLCLSLVFAGTALSLSGQSFQAFWWTLAFSIFLIAYFCNYPNF